MKLLEVYLNSLDNGIGGGRVINTYFLWLHVFSSSMWDGLLISFPVALLSQIYGFQPLFFFFPNKFPVMMFKS